MDSSFANESTSPNFVVITAVNKITGKTKEICTEAPFVIGGIERNKGNATQQNYKSASFYFNTKAALDNVGFDEYTYRELIKYGQNKELKTIVDYLSRNPMVTMEHNFQGTRKQQFMFAYVLFNNGIMSTSGCMQAT
ncbi:hypothetical protein GCM10023149_09060 [Mucilaginibacter gynuensis]|uniref:Uncharacterized protein n=2 Tax=Mucilaginibacter gynuensis TaxID=1302236 RepID=A0ABP8FY27_9SPHI